MVLIQWDFPAQGALFRVAGTAVFLPDFIAFIFLLVALRNGKTILRNLGWLVVPWGMFVCGIAISVTGGVFAFGFGQALNESRSLLVPLAAMAWAMSLNWSSPDEIRRVLLKPLQFVAWVLVGLALYHALRYGVGTATSNFIETDGVYQSGRVLTQLQALTVALAALLAMWRWVSEGRSAFLISFYCFVGVVVISQQRSVWSSLVAALIVTVFIGRPRMRRTLVFMGVLAIVCIFFAIMIAPDSALVSGLSSSFSDKSTYDARLMSWPQLIDGSIRAGPQAVWFGQPFGAGYTRVEANGVTVDYSPHSWYLLLLLRVGIVGLVSWSGAVVWAAARLVLTRNRSPAFALLVTFMVFFLSYGFSWVLCVPAGWALVTAYRSPSVPGRADVRSYVSSAAAKETPRGIRKERYPGDQPWISQPSSTPDS